MKIGILTFPNSTSHGASLQTYALFHTVESLGYSVEIVNYFNRYMKRERHGTGAKNHLLHGAKRILRKALHTAQYRKFRQFEKAGFDLYPKKSFSDKDKLKHLAKRYKTVIVGSDQVFNPDITDRDLSYFLDFCPSSVKRVSYAPSFGVERLEDGFSEAVKSELSLFSALSVREKKGMDLIRKMLGKEVPVVLDPTFLLSKEEWEKKEKRPIPIENDYILYYTVLPSDTLFQACLDFSERTGLKILMVGGNRFSKSSDRVKMVYDISPDEFLYLVHHARYVVTNSFHGTAFSILFERDFYVEFSSRTNSRLEEITEITSLTDRVVREGRIEDRASIDYTKVNERLSDRIAFSRRYLKSALSEEEVSL